MNADNLLRKAMDRLAEIQEEIVVLQQEAREMETAISVMRRFSAEVSAEGGDDTKRTSQKKTVPELVERSPPPRAQPRGMSQTEFEILATRVIEDAAMPLTRTAIVVRLAALGKSLGEDGDASKNAGTKLWRARKKFVNIRGAGYWLRDRPCPTLGYMPDVSSMSDLEEEETVAARDAAQFLNPRSL